MKATNGRFSGDGSVQARRHGGIRGQLPPNLFYAPLNFVVLRKICFKHIIKTKIFPPKMYFSPQTLKLGYGPGSDKIVSEVRICCIEDHSASRYTQHNVKNFFL